MMEGLRLWLTGVTAAAILCALAEALMPQGAVRQVGRLACGLVMLAAILRPLVRLEIPDPAQWLRDWQTAHTVQLQSLEEQRDQSMKSIIEQSLAAYIVDKAAQLGASCTAQVACRQEEAGVFLPYEAQIQGELTPAQQEALAAALEEELAIPRDRLSIQGPQTQEVSP